MNVENKTNILDYLRNIIYNYVEVDDSTAILVLNYKDELSPLQSKYKDYTSGLIRTLLSNTRSGSAQRQFGITFSSFLSGVLVSVIFCVVQVLIFSILRNRLDFIYQPNVNLYATHNKSSTEEAIDYQGSTPLGEKLGNQLWSWIKPTWCTSIEDYREYGLDAYFFLRLLKTLSMFFLMLSIVIIPILIPIHYISGYKTADIENYISKMDLDDKITSEQMLSHLPYGLTGLDKISMSNISPAHNNRLVFHLILAVFLVCFFHHLLLHELRYYVEERNKVLTSQYKDSKSYQNVLFIGNINKDFDRDKIEYFCESLIPGSIDQVVSLPADYKLRRMFGREMYQLISIIESTQLDIIFSKIYFGKDDNLANDDTGYRSKQELSTIFPLYEFRYIYSKGIDLKQKCNPIIYRVRRLSFLLKEIFSGNIFTGFYFKRIHNDNVWKRLLSLKWNPSLIIENKQKKLERYLKKFEMNLALQQDLENHIDGKSSKQAFLVFNKVSFAHIFDQMLLASKSSEMSDDKALGINPEDIVWCNIETVGRVMKLFRVAVSNFLNVTIMIGWVVPVAIVGFVSQIPIITKIAPILTSLEDLPEYISKPLASIVPAVTLIFLTEGVPIFFRWFSVVKCLRTGAQIEIDVQKWFFSFLFVHIFLVVTISSGISVVVETVVNSPINIPHLLGTNLPKCSNFFCSFVLIRGIAYFGGNLLQLKNLLFYLGYYRWAKRTPREKLEYFLDIPVYQWGSLYPIFSVLASISIIYSVIAPFILPLASFSFIFVMFSFKYSLKYQYDHKNRSETLGKFYPQALMQLYSGVYFLEACLIGLFALANCFRLSLFMFIFMIFTVSAHFQISNFTKPIIDYLPASLSSDEIMQPKKDFRLNELESRSHKIWIPQDKNGVSITEGEKWQSKYDIEFVHDNAFINENGKILVSSNPYI